MRDWGDPAWCERGSSQVPRLQPLGGGVNVRALVLTNQDASAPGSQRNSGAPPAHGRVVRPPAGVAQHVRFARDHVGRLVEPDLESGVAEALCRPAEPLLAGRRTGDGPRILPVQDDGAGPGGRLAAVDQGADVGLRVAVEARHEIDVELGAAERRRRLRTEVGVRDAPLGRRGALGHRPVQERELRVDGGLGRGLAARAADLQGHALGQDDRGHAVDEAMANQEFPERPLDVAAVRVPVDLLPGLGPDAGDVGRRDVPRAAVVVPDPERERGSLVDDDQDLVRSERDRRTGEGYDAEQPRALARQARRRDRRDLGFDRMDITERHTPVYLTEMQRRGGTRPAPPLGRWTTGCYALRPFFSRRRANPPRPARPEPSSISVAGSGTGVIAATENSLKAL